MAEFIDNALQAGAGTITVDVRLGDDPQFPIEIAVLDDGAGMDPAELAGALTFGGSTRFNDRTSLGRYGMGLPNGALSRARRLDVYTWRGDEVHCARLDVDELISRGRSTLPPVEAIRRPAFLPSSKAGTLVLLRRCDRLEYKRVSTLVQHFHLDLGRIYRHFLARLDLRVNGRRVEPVDPLFLMPSGGKVEGAQFGDTLTYTLSGPAAPGAIEVVFSELPVDRWHALSVDQKRALGVTSAPCVSVVRAGREIDRGWFFMGTKRRENYDDWWRCEVRFEPALDEHFGITHAKQAITPSEDLLAVLAPDLEPIARALNARVRHRFELVKVTTPLGAAESQAARAEPALPALPRRRDSLPDHLRGVLESGDRHATGGRRPYRIIVAESHTTAAFDVLVRNGQLLLVINARHPLYRDLYGPLALSESDKDQDVAKRVVLALLAAARAEASAAGQVDRGRLRHFRQSWADVMATFLNA